MSGLDRTGIPALPSKLRGPVFRLLRLAGTTRPECLLECHFR
jgi:hypothetical protein